MSVYSKTGIIKIDKRLPNGYDTWMIIGPSQTNIRKESIDHPLLLINAAAVSNSLCRNKRSMLDENVSEKVLQILPYFWNKKTDLFFISSNFWFLSVDALGLCCQKPRHLLVKNSKLLKWKTKRTFFSLLPEYYKISSISLEIFIHH